MTTVFFLIIIGIVASFLGVFILNIAGLPGVLAAGKPGIRSKTQFRVGSLISAFGQSYINLAYVAFVVSWTKFEITNITVTKLVVWIFAFLVATLPVWKDSIRARVEDRENGLKYANPQVEALQITALLTIISFFTFVFAPDIMKMFWNWVPYVGR